jgi:hypothetical protein
MNPSSPTGEAVSFHNRSRFTRMVENPDGKEQLLRYQESLANLMGCGREKRQGTTLLSGG